MRPDVEEGICQVMSHIWLSAELKRMKGRAASDGHGEGQGVFSSPVQMRLGEFFLQQIATDTSPIYGEGFRQGLNAVKQFGLPRVLEHLRITGNFP